MPTKRPNTGFTLVEMLVVAPLVILLIGVIIGFITSITGDSLATNRRGAITYTAQQALDILERDIRLASNFLESSGNLPYEQRPPGGGSSFTPPNALILEQNGTSSNPYDEFRNLVYYQNQPNPCNSSKTLNRALKVRIIYFVHDRTLYKRTVVPEYSTDATNTVCDTPWQRNSCEEGYSSSSICRARDERVATNISSFSVEYYEDSSSTTTTTDLTTANSARVTLETDSRAAGRFSDFKGTMRATKLNPNEKPLEAPSAPSVSVSPTGPATVRFSWQVPDNSTFYDATYGINAQSCTQTTALSDSRDSSYTISRNHGDTVKFCLTAKNLAGESPRVYRSHKIPVIVTEKMQNGWINYSSSFEGFGFTKTPQGEVFVKGLVRNLTSPTLVSTSDRVIATLPPGYRPTHQLIFPAQTYYANGSYSGPTLVVVQTNGVIYAQNNHTDKRWVSLSHIRFMASGSSGCSWLSTNLSSGWANWGGAYPQSSLCRDSAGRVHVQGLVRPDPSTRLPTGTERIATLTANAYVPTQGRLIFPATDYNAFAAFDISYSGDEMRQYFREFNKDYLSTQAEYYSSNYSGNWHNISLQNSWVNYGGHYAPAQYTKNGRVVTVQGLIRYGNDADNTLIGYLPAGYRPNATHIFSVVSANSQARVDVKSNGGIYITDRGSSSWLSLSGISFVVD